MNFESSLNFHENYFSLQTQQQCAAQDFLKISYHFWSIWKKEEKSGKMREIVLRSSFELKNKPLPLILDYDWCNANQDELCISLDSHQFLFYIEPILKTSSRISTETRSSKYTSSYFWCSSLQRTICRLLFLIWSLDQDILASHEWNFAELTSLKKWTSMFLAK